MWRAWWPTHWTPQERQTSWQTKWAHRFSSSHMHLSFLSTWHCYKQTGAPLLSICLRTPTFSYSIEDALSLCMEFPIVFHHKNCFWSLRSALKLDWHLRSTLPVEIGAYISTYYCWRVVISVSPSCRGITHDFIFICFFNWFFFMHLLILILLLCRNILFSFIFFEK